jgi:hypothetical protein
MSSYITAGVLMAACDLINDAKFNHLVKVGTSPDFAIVRYFLKNFLYLFSFLFHLQIKYLENEIWHYKVVLTIQKGQNDSAMPRSILTESSVSMGFGF